VVIDRYVYDPDKDVGETILQTTNGAFLFASGRIKGLKQHKIVVSTLRSWGGPLDKYGVLVLEGGVTVFNQEGVTRSGTGQGTDIPRRSIRQARSSLGPGENCPRHCHHDAALLLCSCSR
jgi:hypothetical protein